MPVTEYYNVFHTDPMHWMIVVYFFFSGLSSGAFFTSCIAHLKGREEYRIVQDVGAYIAPLGMAIGMVFLMLDTGHPLKTWQIFMNFAPTSAAWWGAWIINIFFPITILYAFFTFRGDQIKQRILVITGLPFALLASGYTGVLLMQMKAHALWHSSLLPVLFVISALASGLAVVNLFSIIAGNDAKITTFLSRVLLGIVGIDLVLVAVEILTLFNGHQDAVEIVKELLAGEFAFLFVGIYIILGMIIPLVVLVRKRLTTYQSFAASGLVIIGVAAMRYVIVMAGQYIPLS